MAPPPKQRNLIYKYEKIDGFKTTQAHGVYGGVNIRGQLNINFYVDTIPVVKSTHSSIKDNQVGDEVFPEKELVTVRELHFGVNIDLQTAKSIANWMNAHILAHENATNQEKPNQENKITDNKSE